jgi:AraC-like DNA-binding protein
MAYRTFITQPNLIETPIRFMGTVDETQESFNRHLHIDSYSGLIISFGAPLAIEMDDGRLHELPRVFFKRVDFGGIRQMRATGHAQAIGFDLFAWGSRVLVDEHVDLAANAIVPLDGLWHDLADHLVATFQQRGASEALNELAQFTDDRRKRKQIGLAPVRVTMDTLYAGNGQFNLTELSSQAALSPSQLERQFKYHTGVSPKILARLIRLDGALHSLRDAPVRQMTQVARRFGFTDQAHFIHEMKAFSGYTPRQYLALQP